MCCFTTIFLVLISRVGIIYWWLTNPQARNLAFSNFLPGVLPLPGWLWTLVGGIFLPWTTLAYLLVFQGGIEGSKWVVLAVGFLIDLISHSGSYRHRHHVSRYRRNMRRWIPS